MIVVFSPSIETVYYLSRSRHFKMFQNMYRYVGITGWSNIYLSVNDIFKSQSKLRVFQGNNVLRLLILTSYLAL